ncbi:serine/threonine-protein kinase WNK8-like [Chenopodium quinoa]|uniref:serine/threonine-protein kinase WNK8-like n=1 Tax=Chenopodium quinoa TaxID=63459 RepID=UPI000B785B0E|nr:serine/threonine-protein kinase WNK8-like [Chenopodium quinoa]
MASSSSIEWRIVERDEERKLSRSNKPLGSGSFKKVYLGFDEVKGIEIAWGKIPFTRQIKKSKRCAEAELSMSLEHENIIKCYDHWLDKPNKVVNMITEYCSSGDLRHYILEHNLVANTVMIKNWCRQILSALHYIHTRDQPVCHLDVKCANIFVDGKTGTIKLGDFGIAKAYNQELVIADIKKFGATVAEMADRRLLLCGEVRLGGMVFGGGGPEFFSHPMAYNLSVLAGVKNKEIARFSNKCLPPAPRTTALELLEDSFLAVDVTETSAASTSTAAGNLSLRKSVRDQVAELLQPPAEVLKDFDSRNKKFRLQGKMSEDVLISITLRSITDGNDSVRMMYFEFLLGVDTIPDIMADIAVEFDLSAEVIAVVSENLEQLITEFQPHDSNTPSISKEQQTQDGRSEDNRRRGIRKLKLLSFLCCTKPRSI